MQLLNILSVSQINALQRQALSASISDIHAPNLPARMCEYVHSYIAPTVKRGLSQFFWGALQAAIMENGAAIICVEDKEANVLPVRRNRIFARHIDALLKAGKRMFWVEEKHLYAISMKTWKFTWDLLTDKADTHDLPTPTSRREIRAIQAETKRQRMFYGMSTANVYKKIGKRGFNTSFDEIRAFKTQEDYERRLRKVEDEARKIMREL